MSDSNHPQATVKTKVEQSRRVSLIWAIPAVTVLVGIYLLYDTFSKRGPTITVTFLGGEGLQVNQSHVKHRDVDMGSVKSIVLAPDYSHVIVTLAMKPEATAMLTKKARFWVVKPRLFAGTISGLDTLVSGSYIEILPSTQPGERQRSFTGLEDPPVLQTQEAGHTFLLKSPRVGSISLGSPLFYRDLTVGQVLGWDLSKDAKSVTIHAFVKAPFDGFVNSETRFWDASGISLQLGATGVHVQLESLKALLLGGIAFGDAEGDTATQPSAEDANFPLFESKEAADNAGFMRLIKFVSYFPGAVSGLGVGSPVTFQGIRVGQVTDVGLEYDNATDTVRVPVHYEIQPDRIANVRVTAARGAVENTRMLVEKGLRAELKSANLITGQQEVALEMDATAPPATISELDGVIVMPSIAGGFAGIENAANQLLNKLSHMPFEQIGDNLNTTLHGVSKLVNGTQLADTLVKLHGTLDSADQVVKHLDAGLAPALKQLPAIATDLQTTLARSSTLVGSVGTAYGQDSKFSRDLTRLMAQLNDTARALRALADLLTRHPEALIRGRTNTGPE
jgi:paraquat-inducible protein B